MWILVAVFVLVGCVRVVISQERSAIVWGASLALMDVIAATVLGPYVLSMLAGALAWFALYVVIGRYVNL